MTLEWEVDSDGSDERLTHLADAQRKARVAPHSTVVRISDWVLGFDRYGKKGDREYEEQDDVDGYSGSRRWC